MRRGYDTLAPPQDLGVSTSKVLDEVKKAEPVKP